MSQALKRKRASCEQYILAGESVARWGLGSSVAYCTLVGIALLGIGVECSDSRLAYYTLVGIALFEVANKVATRF